MIFFVRELSPEIESQLSKFMLTFILRVIENKMVLALSIEYNEKNFGHRIS